MKNKMKSFIAVGLSLICVCSMAGCSKEDRMKAEVNPDTPIEEVTFPLEEKQNCLLLQMRLQHPPRIPMREQFLRDWKNRQMYILTGPALWQTSLPIRKI